MVYLVCPLGLVAGEIVALVDGAFCLFGDVPEPLRALFANFLFRNAAVDGSGGER